MLKSGSGFDEVTAYMHCLTLMTTFQEEHQKLWNFSPSVKAETVTSIDTWITPYLCVAIKNILGASNDQEKMVFKIKISKDRSYNKIWYPGKSRLILFWKKMHIQTLKNNSLSLCSMLWCLSLSHFFVETESFTFFFSFPNLC